MLLIASVGLLVWPVYWRASRRSSQRRYIRAGLATFFFLQLLASAFVVYQLPRLLKHDVGRFDDSMYALVALGYLSIFGSIIVLAVGEGTLLLIRVFRKRTGAKGSVGV